MDWREYLKLLTKRNTDELNNLFGLENGAGWITEFMGKPSILFGLEAIAELKWYDKLVV